MKRFALLVSRISDFYFWFPLMLTLAIFNTGLEPDQIKILLPSLFFLEVLLPIALFWWVLKTKMVGDADVTKRAERPKLYGTMTVIVLAATALSFFLGNRTFFILQLIALIVSTSNFLITLKWKISGHLIMNTSFIFVINFLFGFALWWLFIIVPFVVFARLYLKKHTPMQILAGAVVGLAEPYLILKLFGLI